MSKTITIFFTAKNKNIKQKIERELFWYDPIFKKMNIYKGGKLEFEYIKDEELENIGYKNSYRMKPKVIDIYENVYKTDNNKNDIERWFDRYKNYTEATIISKNNDEIEFEVPDNDINDFIDECDRQRFNYI